MTDTSRLNSVYIFACKACKYTWIQPAAFGNCPRCQSDNVVLIEERVNVLPGV